MKLIITILLACMCGFVVAQNKTVINPPTGNRNTITHFADGLFADSILLLRPVCDAPDITMTQYRAAKRWGAIVLDSCNNIWYGYNPRTDEWSPISTAGSQCQNGLNVPGYVSWSGTGLGFDVSGPGLFTLNCVTYNGNAGSVTLDAADPTFPRFDIIAWDTTGAIVVIKGTAGMNPVIPQIDPSSQIALATINLPAGALVPPGVTQTVIYDENTEWTGAAIGITTNFNNTVLPYHLLKSTDAGTWSPTPKTITYTRPTGVERVDAWTMLKLFVYLKAPIAGAGFLRASFLHGSTVVSNIVTIGNGNGLNRALAGVYQNATMPMSAFTFTDSVFDKLRITFTGTGGGAYIDYIQLQAGISPPNPAGTFVDTIYDRSDSLFYIKNNTEYLAQYQPMAKLLQQQFIIIYNADSSYDPYGLDVAIGVDTSALATYITQIINNDTTVVNPGEPTFIVDTVSNSPPVGVPSGYKVLVGESPTGAFAGHANEIAELVGAVWNFTVPQAQDIAQVSNSTQLLFYKFIGPPWVLISVPDLIGGMTGLTAPNIGTRDSNSFTIKTKNIPVITATAEQDVLFHQYENLEDSSIYFKPGIAGKLDTGYFHQLIAGSGITITPGLNRTDTISSTGGGGSQTWQQTLDVGSDLDKDNTVNANNHAFTMYDLLFMQLVSSNGTTTGLFSINVDGASLSAGKPTLGTQVGATADSAIVEASDVNGSDVYKSYMSIVPDYVRFGKRATGGTPTFTPNPKIIYPSDTLLTEPEFMYVADADTIKKYPFSGGGSGGWDSLRKKGAYWDSVTSYIGAAGTFQYRIPQMFNVMDYGAYGDSVHSDAAAIYRAMNAANAAGGGIVYFPRPAVYYNIDTALLGSCNCQIEIPSPANQTSRSTIMLLGAIPPNDIPVGGNLTFFYPTDALGGVRIKSTITSGATNAALIGTADSNKNTIVLQNLSLEVKNNPGTGPVVGGVGLAVANGNVYIDHVVAYVDTAGFHSSLPSVDVSGFEMPNDGITENYVISNSRAQGFRNGFKISEHVTLDKVVAVGCWNGIYAKQGMHGSFGSRVGIYWCTNDIYFGGSLPLYITLLDEEYITAGVSGGKWYDNAYTINDSLNLGGGFINYQTVLAGGTRVDHMVKNGAMVIGTMYLFTTNTEFVGTLSVKNLQGLNTPLVLNSNTGNNLNIKLDQNSVDKWFLGYDNSDKRFRFITSSATSNNEALTILQDTKVGINKAAPAYQLDVESGSSNVARFTNLAGSPASLALNSVAGQNANFIYQNGGTNAWYIGNDGSNDSYRLINSNANGNSRRLDLTQGGILTLNAYGAGTATFDAAGVISSVSDERVKRNIKTYKTGLRELMKINPIEYKYNGLSGNETNGTYVGFSAQNVRDNIPYSTGITADGYLTLQDRALLATMVNAIKEQQAEIEELKKEIRRLKK